MSNLIIEPFQGSSYKASLTDYDDFVRFWVMENPFTRLDRYCIVFEAMTKTGVYDSFYTLLMNRIGYLFYDESDARWIQEVVSEHEGIDRQCPDGYHILPYDGLLADCQDVLHAELKKAVVNDDRDGRGYFERKYRIHTNHSGIPAEIFAKSREDAIGTYRMTHQEDEILEVNQVPILDI